MREAHEALKPAKGARLRRNPPRVPAGTDGGSRDDVACV